MTEETRSEQPAPPPPLPAPSPATAAQPARRPDSASLVIGVILVIAGALFLLGELAPFDLGQYGWPLFVIVPGVVLLGLGIGVRSASGLAIPGSIVTMTGLLLLIQNLTGLWASWAYAWALVAPGAVGVGIIIQGMVAGNRGAIAAGTRTAWTGIVIFLIGFAFFEGALHISGEDFGVVGKVALPVLLVAAGLWLLVRNVRAGGRP